MFQNPNEFAVPRNWNYTILTLLLLSQVQQLLKDRFVCESIQLQKILQPELNGYIQLFIVQMQVLH